MRVLLPLLLMLFVPLATAAPPGGRPLPAALTKPLPLPATNGFGKAAFSHGKTRLALVLSRIEIEPAAELWRVALTYFDGTAHNLLELAFTCQPVPGPVSRDALSSLRVKTRRAGESQAQSGKSRCDLALTKISAREVAGTLSCTGLVDPSGEKAAPDLTGARFSAKAK